MGKKPTFKPNTDTAAPPRPVEALLSSFDPHADYFAIVTQGVDRHRLRIFDTHTATVKTDFSSEKENKFTCMTWGIMQSGGELSEQPSTPSKKKRRSTIPISTTQVLALGLHDGSVAIYSLSQGSVVKTLSGSHTMPVSDFVFTADGRRGYSVAEDHNIVEWNVEEAAEISKWKADTRKISKIALSHSETKLLTAGHTIKLWDLETRTVVKKFIGHASVITSLVFSSTDALCASTAEHDRYINIWDSSSSDITESGNLTALTLDTDVSYLALDGANTVLAVSEDGTLALWQNAGSPTATTGQVASGSSSSHPPPKKRRGATRPPDAVINVVSTVDGKTAIPILRAEFVEGVESGMVLIARGSTVKPTFEKVRYIKEDTGEFMKEIVLSRQPVTGFLIDESSLAASNLKATRKGYDESSVIVLGNTDFGLPDVTLGADSRDGDNDSSARHTDEPTLEEKLKDLAVDEPSAKPTTPAVPQKRPLPKVDSLQQTLVQALHSGDTALLEACLLHSNPEVIRNTVRRLPTAYVVPFLTQLVTKFQGRSNRGEALLEWLKAVLLIHTAYLMTVPDLVKKLSAFYRSLDSRLSVFQKLLQLHGRLDLVMSQIATRVQYTAEDTTNEVVNVYVEEDDEDEDDDDDDDGVMGLEEDEDEDMLDLVGDADELDEEEGEEDRNAMANDTDEEGESEMSEDEDEDDEDDD